MSPLGLVPKKAPVEFRLIHHLSFPEGDSINSNIPKEMTAVSYQSFLFLNKWERELFWLRLILRMPIHPNDFKLLGFQIAGLFYYDKTLPFGLSLLANFLKNLVLLCNGF